MLATAVPPLCRSGMQPPWAEYTITFNITHVPIHAGCDIPSVCYPRHLCHLTRLNSTMRRSYPLLSTPGHVGNGSNISPVHV